MFLESYIKASISFGNFTNLWHKTETQIYVVYFDPVGRVSNNKDQ
jgi:hypothetical protein